MVPPFVRIKEKIFCLSRIQPIEHDLTIDLRLQQRRHLSQIENFPHDGSFQSKKRKEDYSENRLHQSCFFQSRCKEFRMKQLEYEDQLNDIIMNEPLENQYFFNPKGSPI